MESFLLIGNVLQIGGASITLDLSSITVAVVGAIMVFLSTRAVKGIDREFKSVHTEIAEARVENKEKFTEVHTKIERVNDETRSALTKHREKIDEKFDAHDDRIRDLEKGNKHV